MFSGTQTNDAVMLNISAYHQFARDVYRGLRGIHSGLDGQIEHVLSQHHQQDCDKLCIFD